MIIINKAGGLVFQRDFAEGLNKLNINDYLVLAGTFHGYVSLLLSFSVSPFTQLTSLSVHAITTRLSPLPPSSLPNTRPDPPAGIEVLESENFRLQCFTTLTGTKFLLFTEPMQPNTDRIMARVYELYSDYVMKNPFYSLEMPIRCEGWDRRLGGVVAGAGGR